MFVVDMSRPWTIMESLQKWASVLRDHVDKLKIAPEEMRELEQKSELRLALRAACRLEDGGRISRFLVCSSGLQCSISGGTLQP